MNVTAVVNDDDYRDYVLAELRSAHRRAQLYLNEIETIGIGLRGGIIDANGAVEWLHDANALEFLCPEIIDHPSCVLIPFGEAAAAQLS